MEMANDDNQQTTEATEQVAPDGLMAATALAEEAIEPEIPHLAEDVKAEEESEQETLERPEWLPEKFWDEKEGPELEKMAKSYDELQKQFSQGKHKAPEKYDTKVVEESGYQTDDPIVSSTLDWAKKYGINQAAFDELVGSVTSLGNENAKQASADYETEKTALGPNADAIIKSNIDWSDGLERKGIISAQERDELNEWGGTALGQRLMQKVRGMTGDMSKIPLADVAEAGQSESDFKAETQSMMADSRYGSDPKFTREVEARFSRRYK
jgi:hypothetical protein